MDVFRVRDRLIEDYREFTGSFVDIHDKNPRARRRADGPRVPVARPVAVAQPELRLGRHDHRAGSEGLLQPECEEIFRLKDDDPDGSALRLHRHQREAIEAARPGSNYVLTTGTGSGKSLAYIIPIVDHVLAAKASGRTAGDQGDRGLSDERARQQPARRTREVPRHRLPGRPAGHLPGTPARSPLRSARR